MAEHVATVGTDILLVLLKLIVLLYIGCLVLCLIYLVTMRFTTGRSVGKMLLSLRGAFLLSYVASNSMVAMPLAMKSLEDDMDQPRELVQMVIPLALAMNRHAYPLLFALVTVYISQAYGHPLGIEGLLVVCVASAFVGMAAVGPAASVAPMAAVVISSVGLPTQLGIVAMVETTAVVTPMVAMTHLFGSCATTTLLSSIQARDNVG
jgi:Na+/H+-dicarboxylate symporter